MPTKLYVGNLPYVVTENDVTDHFVQAGVVLEVTIPLDRATGRTRGFAFVEMNTEEDANQAISQLNGVELMGRKLSVNIARPKGRD